MRLEFQRVMSFRILDNHAIQRGELFDILPCRGIFDDAILAGQHQQNRQMERFGSSPKIPVQFYAGVKESGGSFMERKWILAKKLEPNRGGCEQGRVAEWNGNAAPGKNGL